MLAGHPPPAHNSTPTLSPIAPPGDGQREACKPYLPIQKTF